MNYLYEIFASQNTNWIFFHSCVSNDINSLNISIRWYEQCSFSPWPVIILDTLSVKYNLSFFKGGGGFKGHIRHCDTIRIGNNIFNYMCMCVLNFKKIISILSFIAKMLHLFKNVDVERYRKEAAELLKMSLPMVSIKRKYTMNIIQDRWFNNII